MLRRFTLCLVALLLAAPLLAAPPAPQRVLAIGDSMMGGVTLMLRASLRGSSRQPLTLLDYHKPSTGLVNTRFFDWDKRLGELLAQQNPDVVLIMLGANDALNMAGSGRGYRHGSDAWSGEYARRVRTLAQRALKASKPVIWIGLPPMAESGFDQKIRLHNQIYRQVAAELSIPFIDASELLGDASQRFRPSIMIGGKAITLRSKDGVHLAPAGGTILANAVLAQLARQR